MNITHTEYFDDQILVDLVTQKGQLVDEGVKLTEQIENIEREQKKIDLKIQKAESKVDVSDLLEKGRELGKQLAEILKATDAIKKEMFERKKSGVPEELPKRYEELDKEKERIERERAKLGHRIQKVKDKIIPRIHKLGQAYLKDEYDDFGSSEMKNGKVMVQFFSHLEDFKARFKKNKAKY